MPETLSTVRYDVLYRLGDAESKVWSKAEIESYIKRGYDRLMLLSGYLWSMSYLDDVAAQATYTLPSRLYQMERVTWDNKKIEPLKSAQLEVHDANYETEEGDVLGYLMDKDGLRVLRKWHVPGTSRALTVTGTWGSPRVITDATEIDTITGTWGVPRLGNYLIDVAFPTRAWGIPRGFSTDSSNTRIEYSSRGRSLDDQEEFDIPDAYTKYIRFYAQARAYGRDGPGQDLRLKEHYDARFTLGVARLSKRRSSVTKHRIGVMGGQVLPRRSGPPRPKLPWNYGKPIRW